MWLNCFLLLRKFSSMVSILYSILIEQIYNVIMRENMKVKNIFKYISIYIYIEREREKVTILYVGKLKLKFQPWKCANKSTGL